MSMLSEAMSMLADGLADAFGVEGGVTYTPKGGSPIAEVVAWVGRTVFRQEPAKPGGAYIVFGDRDYLIPTSGLAQEPQRGDRITEAGQGTFEAMAPGNEPCWRWSDQTRTIYRIHTKRVA